MMNQKIKSNVLSLFSGCGGLDLGFEQAGFNVGLAYDLRAPAIESYNNNRKTNHGHVGDVTELTLDKLDQDYGSKFCPKGVIGGPPCQSFSRGNVNKFDNDPRRKMVREFFSLTLKIHKKRGELDFIVMENVPEVASADSGDLLRLEIERLKRAGFQVHWDIYNAKEYSVPQNRRRLILVALNKKRVVQAWTAPRKHSKILTVKDTIKGIAEPIHFFNSATVETFPVHPNHWCMTPRSDKFTNGTLRPGRSTGRSFKTLGWDKPSYTVSYGHREVHVHPSCTRRLSVYEAMLLQGFPKTYVLHGTLSDQFSQISEAVPPPFAKVIAQSIIESQLKKRSENSSKAAA